MKIVKIMKKKARLENWHNQNMSSSSGKQQKQLAQGAVEQSSSRATFQLEVAAS